MISNYIITIIVILIIDIIWLYINRVNYNNLIRKVQGSDIQLNLIGTSLSYLCVFAGLFIFVIPLIKNDYNKNKEIYDKEKYKWLFILSLKYGGIFGVIMYGIINATNIAVFRNYDYKMAIIDSFWGFGLYSFASFFLIMLEIYRQ